MNMKGKVKVSLSILEILIALGILTIPLFWIGRIARAASTGKALMAYREGVVNIPRYRTWDGSIWSAEADAQDVVGDTHWPVLRACPKRNEKILGVLDHLEDINVQVWNGSTWSAVTELTNNAETGTKRIFDIAYEQSSGDAILVFGLAATATPKYFSWNGSAWGTTAEDCAGIGSGDVHWVRLASKPGEDEIVLVTQDADKYIYAQIWDGSAWGNACKLSGYAAEVTTNQSFDVAYEQSNKRALIVYLDYAADTAVDDTPRYSIWDNGAWGTGGTATDRVYGDQRWAKLAAKPGSNQIVLGTMDDSATPDIQAEIWYSGNSEGWSNMVEVETAGTTVTHRCFDVAYQNSSGKPMIVWGNDDNTAQYCIWDGVDTWAGGDTTAGTTGSVVHWAALASHPDTDEIMLLACYAIDGAQFDDEYVVQKWDGTSWGTISTAETAGYSIYESFAIDYDGPSSRVSIIMRKWRELYH